MQTAKAGDTVKVHYHGTLTDGTVFDSSNGRDPLEFTLGEGMVIPGFDNGVAGMQVGDKKRVHIPVDQAYGPAQEEMIIEFPKDQFPAEMNPEVGMQLALSDQNGQQFPVTIKEIKDDTVILDANHALAGQDLIFDLELMHIQPKSSIILQP